MTASSPWEWSAEEIKRVGYQVVDLVAEHLTQLPSEPVFQPFPDELRQQWLATPVPQEGRPATEILAQFAREIEPYPFGNGHPRFAGWVNPPPVVLSIFAESLAAAMNPSVAGGNHASVHLEQQVVNWLKEITGFPLAAGGLLVSGGSLANLTGLAVARFAKAEPDVRQEGLQPSTAKLIVYVGEGGHSCLTKAVELLGIGHQNIRVIPDDAHFRLDLAALESAIQRDLEAGHRPMAVAASAGTVNMGAIDSFPEIAALCRRYDVWFHIDGAYGTPAILSDRYGPALASINLADSLALDPHKWLYVPVEAGLVLVKDAELMRAAFSLVPPYLAMDEAAQRVSGPRWFSEYGVQQTRGFRALKIWMALSYHGLKGYQAAIEKDITLAESLADQVRANSDFELLEPQSLSIVCFRYKPAGVEEGQLNALNQKLLLDLQLSGRFFLSGTTIRGNFWLRACIVNPRMSQDDISALLEILGELGKMVTI